MMKHIHFNGGCWSNLDIKYYYGDKISFFKYFVIIPLYSEFINFGLSENEKILMLKAKRVV